MILTKRSLLRFFFGAEIVIFIGIYLFSPHGIQKLFNLKKEVALSGLKLSTLKGDVDNLKKQLKEWNEDSFYKEKVAREQLYMAHSKEEVYFTQ